MNPIDTTTPTTRVRLTRGGILLLAAGTPEEQAQIRQLDRAAREERVDRFLHRLDRAMGDLLPVAIPAAAVTLLLGMLALVHFRTRFTRRLSSLRAFFGVPPKLTSRRDLAPHPSALSPNAGRIPLLNRRDMPHR